MKNIITSINDSILITLILKERRYLDLIIINKQDRTTDLKMRSLFVAALATVALLTTETNAVCLMCRK